MPNAKRTRKQLSKQERVQRQNAARDAARMRKQRRSLSAAAAILVAGMLLVFGIVGTGGRNNTAKNKNAVPTTVAGQIVCPNPDGSSKRQTLFDHEPPRCVDSTAVYQATIKT